MRLKESFKKNRDIAAITSFFIIMQLAKWPPLLFWGWWGGGNFLDSWQVLTSSDCYRQNGLEVYKIDNSCMHYVYGRPLLWILSSLQVGASQTSFFGFIFLVVISILLAKLTRTLALDKGQKILVTVLVVASPPILLLVDRGNFDSLIVAGVVLAAWLQGKRRDGFAIVTLFVITLIKYYTAPLIFLMVLISRKRKDKVLAVTLGLISILSAVRDLQITEFVFSSKNPHLTFGLGQEFLYLLEYNKLRWIEDVYKIGGLVLVATSCAYFYLQTKKTPIKLDFYNANKTIKPLYLFSTTILIGCYLSGTNADYRLIFLVISSISLVTLLPENSQYKQSLIWTTVIALWLTFPSGDLEIIGDVLLTLICSFQMVLTGKLLLIRKHKINSTTL